eukprot:PhM_4_TR18027/c10_g2_i2/m.93112
MSSFVQCPLCLELFASDEIEVHADQCGGSIVHEIAIEEGHEYNDVDCDDDNEEVVSDGTEIDSPPHRQDTTESESVALHPYIVDEPVRVDGLAMTTTRKAHAHAVVIDVPHQQQKQQQTQKRSRSVSLPLARSETNTTAAVSVDDELHCTKCYEPLNDDVGVVAPDCGHWLCAACARRHVTEESTHSLSCVRCLHQNCPMTLPENELRRTLTSAAVDAIDRRELESIVGDGGGAVAICPGCSFTFIADTANATTTNTATDMMSRVNVDGIILTVEAAQHRDRYRFRCPRCSIDFCANCSETPYHTGFTCEAFAIRKTRALCQFCDNPAENNNHDHGTVVHCQQEDCVLRAAIACPGALACGHQCYGVSSDTTCLPCLTSGCGSNTCGTNGDEYCTLCYTEPLRCAPCIRLTCGHFFHFSCIEQRVKGRWHTPHITDRYLKCPLCDVAIAHPTLQSLISDEQAIHSRVKALACELAGKPDLSNEERGRYMFYECSKCKAPYYGGQKDCARELEQEQQQEQQQEGQTRASSLFRAVVCVGLHLPNQRNQTDHRRIDTVANNASSHPQDTAGGQQPDAAIQIRHDLNQRGHVIR